MSETNLPKTISALLKPGIHLVCDEVNNYALRTISCFQLIDINYFTYPLSWSQYDIQQQITRKFMFPQHNFILDKNISIKKYPRMVCYTTKRIEKEKHRFSIKKTIAKYKKALDKSKDVSLILCLSEDLIYNENLYLSRRPLIEEDFISNNRFDYKNELFYEIEKWLKKEYKIKFYLKDTKNIYLQIINYIQRKCNFKYYTTLYQLLEDLIEQPYSPIWLFLQNIFTDKHGINLDVDAFNFGSKLKLIFDLKINYTNFAAQIRNKLIGENIWLLREKRRKTFCKENFDDNFAKVIDLEKELRNKSSPSIILKYINTFLGNEK